MNRPFNKFTAADTPLVGSNTGAAREAEARAAPTFPCPECEGVGFFTSGNFHPDDPRCEATWDCENCDGTGEVDYETPSPAPRNLPTMEQVQAQIAKAFGLTGWAKAEAAALRRQA